MARYTYERLSDQDNGFLLWEGPTLPMHVGGIEIFDAKPLMNEFGGIDFERIEQLTESLLHRVPRYRQKIHWVPGERHAVWVDDPHFNIHYHFRHTSLPRPGNDEQLKRLIARIMEQPLDRARPLWETWVVEGLEDDRFALINKIHHCVIDGAAGMDLTQILLSTTPDREIGAAPAYIPRPLPEGRELQINEWRQRIAAPIKAVTEISRFALETPDIAADVVRHARSLRDLATLKAAPVSDTPINGPVGPHRVVAWCEMPLTQLRAIRRELQCTINDVVLTIVTGAVREVMLSRQVRPEQLEFRVSSPVNVRGEEHQETLGNHVSSWVVRLPLAESEPLEQVRIICERTTALKRSNQAGAVEMINAVIDWLPLDMHALSSGTINMVVSNVPGPPFPLYLLGAQMQRIIPYPPLLQNVGLGVAVLSYNGRVFWGFNADYDRVPDVEDFAREIERAFKALAAAAHVDIEAAEEPFDAAVVPPSSPELTSWQHPIRTPGGPSDLDAVSALQTPPPDEAAEDPAVPPS